MQCPTARGRARRPSARAGSKLTGAIWNEHKNHSRHGAEQGQQDGSRHNNPIPSSSPDPSTVRNSALTPSLDNADCRSRTSCDARRRRSLRGAAPTMPIDVPPPTQPVPAMVKPCRHRPALSGRLRRAPAQPHRRLRAVHPRSPANRSRRPSSPCSREPQRRSSRCGPTAVPAPSAATDHDHGPRRPASLRIHRSPPGRVAPHHLARQWDRSQDRVGGPGKGSAGGQTSSGSSSDRPDRSGRRSWVIRQFSITGDPAGPVSAVARARGDPCTPECAGLSGPARHPCCAAVPRRLPWTSDRRPWPYPPSPAGQHVQEIRAT